MISYGPSDVNAAKIRPAASPRRGNHRAKVMRATGNGALTCRDSRGKRPKVAVPARAPSVVDDVAAEFAVMQAVGNALAQLADAESQTRVLRWAVDRFPSERAAGPAVASSAEFAAPSTEGFRLFMECDQDAAASAEFAAPSTTKVDDPGLTLDGFDPFAELSMAAAALEWQRA